MSEEQQNSYRALGITFMVLGFSIGLTFGLTLGWAFAPIGITFFALGIVFLQKEEKSE